MSCLGVFLLVTALTALNVALPDIGVDLDAEIDDLQWIVDAYAVTFAGLLLAGGAIGDRVGRRRALIVGFVLFAFGNGLGAVAGSVDIMLIARAIAGIGAALMMPATLSTITEVFNDVDRGRAIAIWAGLAGAGGAFGPALGGWLLTIADWHAVFAFNVALALLGLIGAILWVPALPGQRVGSFDYLGALLSVAAVACLVFVAIEGPAHPFAPSTVAGAIGAMVLICAFIAYESRVSNPLMPLTLFGDRERVAGVGTLLIAAIGFNGVLFVAALMLQIGWQESALATGLLLLPIGAAEVIVANYSISIADRLGRENAITAGLVIMAVGYVGMALAPEGGRMLFVVAGLIAGFGNGLTIPLSVGRIVGDVEPEVAGVASSLNEMSIELGASIGIGLLGAIQALVFERQNVDGSSTRISEIADDAGRAAFRTASHAGLYFAAGAMAIAIVVARGNYAGITSRAAVARPSGTQS